MKHILIEFQDGSLKWIQNTTEQNVLKIQGFKRIKADSTFRNFYFTKKRWKESKESQFKTMVFD